MPPTTMVASIRTIRSSTRPTLRFSTRPNAHFMPCLASAPSRSVKLFTHTISDPITKNAYEIVTTGATLGYAPANFFGLDAAFTVYKGEKVMDQVGTIGGLTRDTTSVSPALSPVLCRPQMMSRPILPGCLQARLKALTVWRGL